MTSYLLDTNHVSAILRNEAGIAEQLASHRNGELGVAVPTLGELWYMVFNSRQVEANSRELHRLIARLRIWPFDEEASMEFGRIRTDLRRRGRPIPAIDVQIAAIASIHELTVLTADSHFQHIGGLEIENWVVE